MQAPDTHCRIRILRLCGFAVMCKSGYCSNIKAGRCIRTCPPFFSLKNSCFDNSFNLRNFGYRVGSAYKRITIVAFCSA